MKLAEHTITAFAENVASTSPAPGGGSCAALYGALGAALTAMVSAMTQGREKYADFAAHAAETQKACEDLQAKLIDVMDRDTDAFQKVSDAFALPKGTDEEKAARSAAIQEGLKACTETPLEMLLLCDAAATQAASLVGRFNDNCASDLGVAALSLKAGAQGAWLNVLINIGSLKDKAYAEEKRAEGKALLDHAVKMADECYEAMLKLVDGQ